ncbi:MAG: serine/threonine protein kinase, partial [Polyangiales bacterium]
MTSDKREVIGPYRIVRKLAAGGMAEIFLAKQRGLEGVERSVVLKRILPEHHNDEEFVTMFLDEARLLAALAHPNIAQTFDLGRQGLSYYLVMEYVRGPTLWKVLRRAAKTGGRGLPEREALSIVLGVAEALAYVHERHDEFGRPLNIVHRDLNPANVILSYDGAVKLIDFGIAKAASKVHQTRTEVVKGTYGYIAPEQLNQASQVDHRTDVYALGVLMYEVCVGRHPFEAEGLV